MQLRQADTTTPQSRNQSRTDYELVTRICAGEPALLELIMRRYNQRLFRIARAILRDDGEAEEIVQDTYIRAYHHLSDFHGPQGFGSWLCRIAVNQARMRARRADWQTRQPVCTALDNTRPEAAMNRSASPTPEDDMYRSQLRELLQHAIDDLPDTYRVAFMLREVEQMSVREAATCLDIEPGTVKTRVFRARRQLRRLLRDEIHTSTREAFGFAGHRCDRIVTTVFRRLHDVI